MTTSNDPIFDGKPPMGTYDGLAWDRLNAHWERHNNRRGLPNWVGTALKRAGEVTGSALRRSANAMPEVVKEQMRHAGDAVANTAARPALAGATEMLELFNAWALELNNPKSVEKLANSRGLEIVSFSDLRQHDLKVCDRLLTSNILKWRSVGALEGGGMGLLALVSVAGFPVSIGADILVIQVLSTAIASRIAYSYGYDAKDADEQVFIQRLVRRSFIAQAAKAEPLRDVSRAAVAINGRVRWSDKLRADHRLVAALEKLLQQVVPAGSKVPVQSVAKALPFVGILIGAGMNSMILANVAADAQRYCQTRFLCDKYGLPLPAALTTEQDDDPVADAA